MSISRLQAFFAYEENEEEHIDDILSLLSGQKDQVERQIEQLLGDLEHVKRKLNYYSDIKLSIESGAPRPCWNDYKKQGEDEPVNVTEPPSAKRRAEVLLSCICKSQVSRVR